MNAKQLYIYKFLYYLYTTKRQKEKQQTESCGSSIKY